MATAYLKKCSCYGGFDCDVCNPSRYHKMKKPETANDWLKVLTHAGKKTADEVPPGFKTIEQISKETGKSSTMVRRQLNEAVKLGLV